MSVRESRPVIPNCRVPVRRIGETAAAKREDPANEPPPAHACPLGDSRSTRSWLALDTDDCIQSITIQLSRDQLRLVDGLRVGRNVCRDQLIVEPIEHAKPRGSSDASQVDSAQIRGGQVWPG
jgi:hypothetical protein